jgi:hypothetical protein
MPADTAPSTETFADRLARLHDELRGLRQLIDNDAEVPERYSMTLRGHLAESDAQAISAAADVLHRLMLWHRYPDTVADESYFAAHL